MKSFTELKFLSQYLTSIENYLIVEKYIDDISYNIKEYSQAIIKHYFRLLVLENTLSFTKICL